MDNQCTCTKDSEMTKSEKEYSEKWCRSIHRLEAERDALVEDIKFALANCHEDNYLMVLHWNAHDRLEQALLPKGE